MKASTHRRLLQLYQFAAKRHILTRFNELTKSERFSREDLLALQRQNLYRILRYAYHYVPYYRHVFNQVNFKADEVFANPHNIQKLPILTKDIIRQHFDNLITTYPQYRAKAYLNSTSGSTGHPLEFMIDNNFRDYFTADFHRHLTWGGEWQFGEAHGYIGGDSFENNSKQKLRNYIMNQVFNRVTTNAYSLSPESLTKFANKLQQNKAKMLYGYASSLYQFAKFVREQAIKDLSFEFISSSAEVMYPAQKQFIEETFNCQVLERYASRELGALAAQCKYKKGLHISMENVYIEILDDDGHPVEPGTPGNIIVTNFNNYSMPLIRYNLADVIAWYPENKCPCGRVHDMLSIVEGRHNDMFKTRDGRLVWGGIANPLWNNPNVKQFQYIQKSYQLVLVRIVKAGELSPDDKKRVRQVVQKAMGKEVKVTFEFVAEIEVDKSGKHRYQICEIKDTPN